MADADSDRSFSELASMLRDRKLEWVVEQVESQIAAGKPQIKNVVAEPDQPFELIQQDVSRRRRRKTKLLGSVAYTPEERVALLCDAVQHVVVSAADIENALFSQTGASTIRFVADTGETVSDIQASDTAERQPAARRLEELLRTVRRDEAAE